MRLTAWGARRLIKSALEAPTCDLALIRRRMGIRRWLPSVLPRGLAVTSTTLAGSSSHSDVTVSPPACPVW